MKLKPIVKKPLGGSRLGRGFGGNWDNLHQGDDGPVVCGICGTEHPKDNDETHIISRFLGREVVECCCGAIIDAVYKESGEEFALVFLEEFAENPTDHRFDGLLDTLGRTLLQARQRLAEVKGQAGEALKHLDDINTAIGGK